MYLSYEAEYRGIWTPCCADCVHYVKAKTLCAFTDGELPELDENDMVCSNYYCDHYLELMDDTDTCEGVEEC
jgi:hypothetical protein